MRIRSARWPLVFAALVASLNAAAQPTPPSGRSKAGACAAFVRRLSDRDRWGVARPDLYDGLSGWIAVKAGMDPGAVDRAARTSTADAVACAEFGLAPEPLRALDSVVAKALPPDEVRDAAEICLADLRLLDDTADGPRQATLRAMDEEQMKILGRLLAYLAREMRPPPGAVDARLEALRGRPGDVRVAALGSLGSCEPLGVNVALVRQAHGTERASR